MRSARCCRRMPSSSTRPFRRAPASARSSAATIRRAFTACAAAASAGACRRRSASSSLCRTGRCVALVGDGSAMYTCQALWTAAHERIAAVFVILNNSSYRILKQRLRRAARARRAGRPLCRHGADRSGDRLCRSRALARRRGRARDHRARRHRSHRARACKSDAPLLIDVPVDRNYKPV